MLSKILNNMTPLPLLRMEKHCKLALLWTNVFFFAYFPTCVKLGVESASFWCITLIRIRIQLSTLMLILVQLFTLKRIWILFYIKIMRICNHWPTKPPGLQFKPPSLHFELIDPPGLHFEPPNLQNFDFYADLDPALTLTWIRIQLSQTMRINADRIDMQPCFYLLRNSYSTIARPSP